MVCKRFQRELAHYRELAPAQRQALDEHLRTCAHCRRALAAYARQDALLGGLAPVQPSPEWARRVRERLSAQGERPKAAHPAWARAWALALLAALLLFGSTLAVSANALPGQPLYALKRTQEELRLRLLAEGTPRAEYAQTLAERRREEAKRLIQKGGTAELAFEGPVEAMQGAWWRVGGVEVQVMGTVRPDPLPALGERVSLRVRIQGGHAVALAVFRAAPSPTPNGGGPQPTLTQEAPSATARPSEATPTPRREGQMPSRALPPAPSITPAPSALPTFVPPGQQKKALQPTPPVPTPTAPAGEGQTPSSPGGKGPTESKRPTEAPGGAPRGRP